MAKQQTPIVPVRWNFNPKNGLISDADPKDVPGGGLFTTTANTGGLNIRSVGKEGRLFNGIEPIYGNTLAYLLEEVTVQNKLFRLHIDISAVTSGTTSEYILTLTSVTGTQFVSSTNTITVTTITAALSDILADVNAAFSALTVVASTTQTGTYTGYIDIEFTAAPYFNYLLSQSVETNVMELEVEVTRESVDPSMLGEWNLIGSDDEIGDSVQFWTTRNTLPQEIEIFNITNPASTTIEVETSVAHGLVDGQSVRISGVIGAIEANGEWVITNVTATTFELVLAVYASVYISGGTVTTSVYGLGEIGVAVRSDQGVISYTRLLRSNEFNFSTLKQIDCRTKRKQDAKIATYFCDNFNQYRVFYYKGEYITDGAILAVSDDGQYSYGSIKIDLQLFISNEGFGIAFSSQSQTGGNVKSGNWRYAVRFLTGELVPSEWSLLTDTVSVFTSNVDGEGYSILGDSENIDTPKMNILEITNAIPGIYTFCEIAAINYIETSMVGYIIGRYTLDGSLTQQITHTGNENNLIDLDIGSLNILIPGIERGQNIELLDNRLIISNLTPQSVVDFTPWVETFMYSLEREGLDPVGEWYNALPGLLNVAEYQRPDNIYFKKSHMIYETYRYGFRFRLKASGALTPVYYPGYDIKIDLPTTLPPERIAGSFTSFDLTDGAAAQPTEVYSIYINWLNINLGYIINGVPVFDLISEIIVCRAEVIPEVLLSGGVILGMSGVNTALTPNDEFYYGISSAAPHIGPFSYIAGWSNVSAVATGPNPTYPGETIGAPYEVAERDTVFFYAPDFSFNQTRITFRDGDQIISFGNDFRHNLAIFTSGLIESDYAEFSGYSGITANPSPALVNDIAEAAMQTESVVVNGKSCSLVYTHETPLLTPALHPYYVDQCVICGLSANLNNTGANTDYGFYRAIYYRPIADKYGDPQTTKYTEFNAPYVVGVNVGYIDSGTIVSYGDVFTQKTYLKFRNPGSSVPEVPPTPDGFGVGIGYYSQNRNNLQLRRKPTPAYSASLIIPTYPQEAWLVFGVETASAPYILGRDAQFFYNKGYTPRNKITTALAFDDNDNYQIDWGNAIMWSNSEVDGSNTDYMRIFGPLNIKFLDYTFGSITDARDVNGELITIQKSHVLRQYFNTTELITSEIGSEVILGDGGVMRRKGQTLTKFGSQHKWSVIIGKSDKGHDVLYFIDANNRTACQYGYNGNNAIDEINGMKSFFANNLQWIIGKQTPAHDEGIRGVSNQRYREILWTLRGRKYFPDWEREETSENLISGFSITYGNEMIVNPYFAGPSGSAVVELDVNCPGWQQLGANPPATWFWNPPQPTSGYPLPHALKPVAIGTGDYMQQIVPLAFVPGEIYVVEVIVYATGAPLQIRFQIPSAAIYIISTPGVYYYTYIAQAGDDNFYIYGPAAATQRIPKVSIRKVISTAGWTGGGTWSFGAAGATADGSDADDLNQSIPAYLSDGLNYELTYEVRFIGVTPAGAVTAYLSDQADTPRSAADIYTFSATPTVPGVVKFVPSGGFNGTITQKIRLYSVNPKYYSIGDGVTVPGLSTFSGTDDIYIAVTENFNSFPTPTNPDWQLIDHTNPLYYTEYTIIFAELKNAFSSFFSILPKIYAKLLNSYLVPRPKSNTSKMYEADSGTPTAWFADSDGTQTAEAYFDAIISAPPGRKRFLNVRVEAEFTPERMDIQTDSGFSFTPNSRFVERPAKEFDAPVMNDSTVTNASDGDTSTMYGDWARFRFVIAPTTYNRINNFVAKVRNLARLFYK